MAWLWIALILYFISIAPVKAGCILRTDSGKKVMAAVGVMFWGIRLQRAQPLALLSSKEEKIEGTSQNSQSLPAHLKKVFLFLGTLFRGDKARKALWQAIKMDELTGVIKIGLPDASQTALLAALCHAFCACLNLNRRIRLHTQADFHSRCSLYLRCIVHARLGNLFLACLMGVLAYMTEYVKEKQLWKKTQLKI